MKLRERMVQCAAALYSNRDELPTVEASEYFRGQVEMIADMTGNGWNDDFDNLREYIAEEIRRAIVSHGR